MPDYTRMDIMRMSDEEIKEAIAKEGEYLPEGVLEVMLDELKRRSESAEMPELGLSEEEIEELNAQADGEEPEEEEEPLEEPTNEAKEEDAKEDEAEKLKLLSEEIERQNSENRRILIIASVAAGIVAVGSIVVLLILKMLGKL